ncbi:MAG: caspase family protein [Planctomycetaceae bacterium]|jgi:hypothetical protein|nr:caspase family protein [Planctomycetaceae bacterium]
MKKIFITLTLTITLLVNIANIQAQSDPRGIDVVQKNIRRWAILVGVNDYVKLNDLNFCVSDIEGFKKELLKHGYAEERIFCLTTNSGKAGFNPTSTNINRIINQVFPLLREGDQILIVLSGHGLMIDNKSYYCPEDADDEDLKTLINIEQLYGIMGNSRAANKVLVVDACRTRPADSKVAVPNEIVKKTSKNPLAGRKAANGAKAIEKLPPPPKGIALLTSCDEGEYSFEDADLQHGVFSHFLIDAIQGSADANNDGLISLLELSSYVCEKTPLYTIKRFSASQTPYIAGKTTACYIATTKRNPIQESINNPVNANQTPPVPRLQESAKDYTLNLSNVQMGTLPTGWNGPNNAVVNNLYGSKCITTSTKTAEITVKDLFNQPGDFAINFDYISRYSDRGKIVDNNGNTISFNVGRSGYGLDGARSRGRSSATSSSLSITITRIGEVFSLNQQGADAVVIRNPNFKTLTGFSFTIGGPDGGISSFTVRQLKN